MLPNIDPDRLAAALATARADLLAESVDDPVHGGVHWVGELSGSALSTATAISALALIQSRLPNERADLPCSASADAPTCELIERLISKGLNWLADHQNDDGGWGDTDKSHSNIATTMLVRAAFQMNGVPVDHSDLADRADAYIRREGGIPALRRRYGRDKTFVIPILANCALAGMVEWSEVAALPFELACLPQKWFRFLRLPVVSYALPALVAVGQATYFFRPPLNPLARYIRKKAVAPSLEVLTGMQPASGGYLEAIPLTSFVVMCLAGTGKVDHPVVRNGMRFLIESMRPDGSWPIDTNLATWVTTLSVNALAAGDDDLGEADCLDWLLDCQLREQHPFTAAEPGGWAWTDLSGGVPDADDTSGALLALAAFRDAPPCADHNSNGERRRDLAEPARAGVEWLLNLQNSDGGWPTFCRGWGRLPFDRSGTDLTAHAIRAMHAWRELEEDRRLANDGGRAAEAIRRGLSYLTARQQADGSWLPLWFGNQDRPEEVNPVYGTARVLLVYRDLDQWDAAPAKGIEWLVSAQNPDGSWGAPLPPLPAENRKKASRAPRFTSSIEETAVAVEALLGVPPRMTTPAVLESINRGLGWLTDAVEANRHVENSPIGFYFAKLWYYEKLYPMIFSVAALGAAAKQLPSVREPAARVVRESRPAPAPFLRTH